MGGEGRRQGERERREEGREVKGWNGKGGEMVGTSEISWERAVGEGERVREGRRVSLP